MSPSPYSGASKRGASKRGVRKSWPEACARPRGVQGTSWNQEEGAMISGRFHGLGHDIHTPLVLTPLFAGPDARAGHAIGVRPG